MEETAFVRETDQRRVTFGWGVRASAIGEELMRLGVERAMIVTTPSRADLAAEVARIVLDRAGIVYPGAQPNAPTDVTEAAITAASSVKADGLVAIGGGTAIALSKAIGLRTGLPQVAVQTTFAGVEGAPFVSETERGGRIERPGGTVLPKAAIYDPELFAQLSPSIAGPSAMNAMANALDALGSPNDASAAAAALRAISAALPRLAANSTDAAALSEAVHGASLLEVGDWPTTRHARLCQALIDAFGLVHADVHCVMLPYTAALRRSVAPDAMRMAAAAMEVDDVPAALYDLMQLVAPGKSLRELAAPKDALERLCDRLQGDFEPARRADVLETMIAAYEGRRP
jgi:alcohol dehydrogenase class IV